MKRASGRTEPPPRRTEPAPTVKASAPPARQSTEVKPAPAPAVASRAEPISDDVFWERVVDLASERTTDAVLIDQLELVEQRSDQVVLRLVDGSTNGQGWVSDRRSRLEELLGRVSGATRKIVVLDPVHPAPPAASEADHSKIRQNPVVREALLQFDATIHSVRELPASRHATPGAVEDV